MPIKDINQRRKANREARARERTELKTLRDQVAKIREALSMPPSVSSVEVRGMIERILYPDLAAPTPTLPTPQQEPDPESTQETETLGVTVSPEPTTDPELSPYWKHQRELSRPQTKQGWTTVYQKPNSQKEQCTP
jgi:hypothetical protein